MEKINDLQIGIAGEYLVCADLILNGYTAYPSGQGLHYDIVLDTGKELLKVQVKTTRKPQLVPNRTKDTKKYCFHVRRCGKGGRRSYEKSDVDIFALVALDKRSIGYIKSGMEKQTMFFLPEGEIPVKDATKKKGEIMELRGRGMTFASIGERLNVDPAYAHRVVHGKENKSFSRSYLSDYKIEKCLQ